MIPMAAGEQGGMEGGREEEGAVVVRCGPAAAAWEQIKEGGKSAQAYDKKALEHSKRK
jgi:hypothetical protein